jgi:uncharacterized protein (TIGR03492 family)
MTKILFISNGTGEDLNGSQVLKAVKQLAPQIELMALPVVGEGNAYRQLGVDLIATTQSLPSRGFLYMNQMELLKDLKAGLIGLTITQVRSLLANRHKFDLVFATGDVVVLAMAWLTGCNYAAFLVSASAHYENRFDLPWLTNFLLRSPRCVKIFCRDRFTAELCHLQGLDRAIFAGYPIMDLLSTSAKDLRLNPNQTMVAFLPGSRLPEACANLGLMLQLALLLPEQIQFCAAIVPSMINELATIADSEGWHLSEDLVFSQLQNNQEIKVQCFSDAFADILNRSDLVVGMAGTAVEQAVGLGKPVIQIPGKGPQFTYRFAEAQMRLLGKSVQTISKNTFNSETLSQAASIIIKTLADREYDQICQQNGLERVGEKGGSVAIARILLQMVNLGFTQI